MPVQTRSGAVTENPPPVHHRKKTVKRKSERNTEGQNIDQETKTGAKKRSAEAVDEGDETKAEQSEYKKPKVTEEGSSADPNKYSFHEGVIERGHIYFFYRPKVMHEEAHSIDEVRNFHMLLVPRPPEFSTEVEGHSDTSSQNEDQDELNLIGEGADAVPAPEPKGIPTKHYRLITLGKKRLPGLDKPGRKDTLWAMVSTVGENLHELDDGLGKKTNETKTRGTRFEEPVRLAGRGAYAIVNARGKTPSQNETHLGYHLSHPLSIGGVQEALGVHTSSSFVLQVKNPLAPATGRVGLPPNRRAKYPAGIMNNVFGRGTRGRQSYGLRFSTCSCVDLLEYEGAELLLIAARTGTQGNDTSLGDNRGEALQEASEKEAKEPIADVFKELEMDMNVFPGEPLEGNWI